MTRAPLAVGAAFAAQGFGYAALVTALPSLRARTGLEVIARVNLFNYAAALIGAVIPGLVAEFASLNWAFLLPAVVAVASIPLTKVLHDRVIAKP